MSTPVQSLKSGLDAQSLIIPGESPEAFAHLRDEYYDRFTPADPEQRFHLDTAIRHDWILRRLQKTEEQLWALASSRIEDPKTHLQLGQSWDKENPVMMRLHRRIAYSEKAYRQAMETFHRLQGEKPAPQRQQTKSETPKLASFRTDDPQPKSQQAATGPQPLNPQPRPRTSGWTGNEPPAWRL